MARTVRQKRARRSGRSTIKQHPRSKKQYNVFGNPLVGAHWDKLQTLSQNYRRLGLAARLNAPTGGTQKSRIARGTKPTTSASATHVKAGLVTLTAAEETARTQAGHPLKKWNATVHDVEDLEEMAVERDPSTGRILRILSSNENPSPQYYTHLTPPSDLTSNATTQGDKKSRNRQESKLFEDEHASMGHLGSSACQSSSEVIEEFVAQTAALQQLPKPHRKRSSREDAWIEALIKAHGPSNFNAMARDTRLNIWQQSVGDIKRRVTRWLEDHDHDNAITT